MSQLLGISMLLLGSGEGDLESGDVGQLGWLRGLPTLGRAAHRAKPEAQTGDITARLPRIGRKRDASSSALQVPELRAWRAVFEVRAPDGLRRCRFVSFRQTAQVALWKAPNCIHVNARATAINKVN